MIKINPQVYRSIVFAFATVMVIKIIKPTSFLSSLAIAILLSAIFGTGMALLQENKK